MISDCRLCRFAGWPAGCKDLFVVVCSLAGRCGGSVVSCLSDEFMCTQAQRTVKRELVRALSPSSHGGERERVCVCVCVCV